MNMDGKTAFVTGAATGIGRASALAFAAAGAQVMAVDVNVAELAETERLVLANGGIVATANVDVSDAEAVQSAADKTVELYGRLDYAHNNAGIIAPPSLVADTPVSTFRKLMDVNLFGVLNGMQAQIKHMLRSGGGAIVNTASVNSLTPISGFSAYVTSKHALLGLTRTAALEYAPKNIRINAVCPGFVETPMTDEFMGDPAAREHILSQHPIGRPSKSEEIAEAVIWLCSEKSSYVIGLPLVIDGGYILTSG